MTAASQPWDSLWLNTRLATLATPTGYGIIDAGALAVLGDTVAYVGLMDELPHREAKHVYDLRGAWVTPGLIDCHTHIVFGGERVGEFEQRLEGRSYQEIAAAGGGILATVRATREADEAALVDSALARLDSLQAGGVTTLEVKSGYGLDLASEARMLRAARQLAEHRAITVHTTCLAAHALAPEYADDADAYIDRLCNEWLPELAPLSDAVDAFCESIAFSPVQVRRVFEAAQRLGLPVKLHADQLSNLHGAALAAEFNALSADHLEYTDAAGVQAMAQAGCVAVLLPGAFYCLRESRLPPIEGFRAHGVPMAVATDLNPGSSPLRSPLLAMNMACTLFRLTPAEALAGMTRHAAQALGIARSHGSLQVGKVADFAVWSVNHPAELGYWLGGDPLLGLVRGGEWVPGVGCQSWQSA